MTASAAIPCAAHVVQKTMNSEEIASHFGYTQGWFDLGIIDSVVLKMQWKTFSESDDKNPEHYRFRAFLSYLKRKKEFSNEEIPSILELDENTDLGGDLHTSRLIEFIESDALTDDQFQGLGSEPSILKSPIFDRYVRKGIFRYLRSKGMTEELKDRIKNTSDKFLHSALLESEGADPADFQWLKTHGANKGIRTRANQKLLHNK